MRLEVSLPLLDPWPRNNHIRASLGNAREFHWQRNVLTQQCFTYIQAQRNPAGTRNIIQSRTWSMVPRQQIYLTYYVHINLEVITQDNSNLRGNACTRRLTGFGDWLALIAWFDYLTQHTATFNRAVSSLYTKCHRRVLVTCWCSSGPHILIACSIYMQYDLIRELSSQCTYNCDLIN